MKVAYVIGPYRAPSDYEIKKNIQKAEDLAAELWKLGFAAFCPHKNSAFFSGLVPEENFLKAGEIFLRKVADLVVCVDGWERSEGSQREKKVCEEENIPFYSSLNELVKVMDEGKVQA